MLRFQRAHPQPVLTEGAYVAVNSAPSVVNLTGIFQALFDHLKELSLLWITLSKLVLAHREERYIEAREVLVKKAPKLGFDGILVA